MIFDMEIYVSGVDVRAERWSVFTFSQKASLAAVNIGA
jgi:hypothetical protein